MRNLFLLLATVVLFSAPAFAGDYCEGRSPRTKGCETYNSAPLVCGYERVLPEDSIATTHDYVCRRGGRVVFVRKGRDNNYDIDDRRERTY